ncbi:MAG: VPLPA-CTERM sorting domain-containing protein [Gemmatimonadaceae bacterium]|nr:VPLPA-CTERM sorting domain-containing protein [Gemmatimonadaceae bacterium]
MARRLNDGDAGSKAFIPSPHRVPIMKKIALAILTAAALAAAPTESQAQACAGFGGFTAATFNWGAGITYIDCYGPQSGAANAAANQAAYLNANYGIYGPFSLLGKSDDPNGGPFTGNDLNPLVFDTPISGYFALGLQQAGSYSMYILRADPSAASVNWNTLGVAGNGGTTGEQLSHAVLYQGGTPTRVPEPASFGLIAAGLAGLGVVARRRKA